MTTRIFRSVNRDIGVVVEGEYRQLSWGEWELKRWRLGSCYKGNNSAGEWHKVHGNQRKDIGVLKLVRPDLPDTCPPDPFNFWS